MNILFDLISSQPGYNDGFHGGGEYSKTVFYKLCELLPSGVSLEVFYNPEKSIENSISKICQTKGVVINFCKTNADISNLLISKKYDVFYSALPYSFADLVIPQETKFIYTIHGLRSLEYPADKYALKYRKRKLKTLIRHTLFSLFPFFPGIYKEKQLRSFNSIFSLTENQTIITVSNHSKFSISYFFPNVDITRIKVFYSPLKNYDFDKNENPQILKSLALEPGKYILLVGGDRSVKGAYRACRVLYKLMEQQNRLPKNTKVLVLGVSHFAPYRKLTNNSNRFVFHNYVPTGDLETLYKNAFLFLFPTMNEGFGIPPLEAMKYGVLCACSANSAITEVYGDSVLYFNPFDEIEMGIRILQGFDENTRKEKSQKIMERYQLIRKKQEQDLDLLVQEIFTS